MKSEGDLKLAKIQRMKPDSFSGAIMQYSADQKACFLASILLLDYMFFESDSDMMKFEN